MGIAFVVLVALIAVQQTAPPQKPPACETRPEARQFDFWIGEWDVVANGKPAGINRIEKILGGCVLQENWTGAGGSSGKSWNWFDIGDRKWHQLWLDAAGNPQLNLSGSVTGDVMKYEGTSIGPKGITIHNRLQFFKLEGDRVRQLWEQSRDGGTTWSVVFDGEYRRRKS